MAKRKTQHQTALLSKLLWLDVLVVGAMSLLSIGLSARYSVKLLEDGLSQNLHNVAKMLATSDQVVAAMENGRVDPGLDKYLRSIIADQNNVDVITLARMDSIRLFHPEPDRIGKLFQGGDEGRVLNGEHYPSEAVGTLGLQMRYFYPIFGRDGRQIGFAHVSMLMRNLTRLRDNVLMVQFQTLLVVLVVGAVGALLLSMSIKRSLLGFEPGQIADIFLRRGEIIDSLAEGLLAVDEDGKVILLNAAAQGLLGVDAPTMMEKDIDNFFPQLRIKEAIRPAAEAAANKKPSPAQGPKPGEAEDKGPGQPEDDRTGQSDDKKPGKAEHQADDHPERRRLSVAINDNHILCDRVPIVADASTIGAVAILRDHSEVVRLAEQLTGVNHVLDAMRANTHEYMNQLHIILGLIRGGDLVEAERFITSVGDFQNATVSTVIKSLQNQVVSALILGKINRCHELGIKLRLAPHSAMPRHSRFLTTRALVTLVGNLVDNAIDAINEKSGSEEASMTLLIREDPQSLMISLDDTGVGMTAEEIAKISRGGWSTKGDHRGLGMSLIHGVVKSYGGELAIESDKGVGTSMSLVFTRPRPGRGPVSAPPEIPAKSPESAQADAPVAIQADAPEAISPGAPNSSAAKPQNGAGTP